MTVERPGRGPGATRPSTSVSRPLILKVERALQAVPQRAQQSRKQKQGNKQICLAGLLQAYCP